MHQIVVKSGKTLLEDVPKPIIMPGTILVKVHYSCISQGTEISGVKSSGKSATKKIIEAIKTKPEKIKKGLDLLKRKGSLKLLKK